MVAKRFTCLNIFAVHKKSKFFIEQVAPTVVEEDKFNMRKAICCI